ncbi:MAG TPA: hypothetical protein VGM90_26495 [Kofleriaceae bacterium]|jgi:hypothetical protein
MARYVSATHRGTLARDFLCGKCHTSGTTTVDAVGTAKKRVWISRDAAADRAHDDAAESLQRDGDRIVRLIRCPKCHERGESLLVSLWHLFIELVVALGAGAVVGGLVLAAVHSLLLSAALGVVVAGALLFVGDERRRRKEAAAAKIDLTPRITTPTPKAPVRPSTAVDANPFRAPPAPPPIAVVATTQASAVPIAKNDDVAAPKLLS